MKITFNLSLFLLAENDLFVVKFNISAFLVLVRILFEVINCKQEGVVQIKYSLLLVAIYCGTESDLREARKGEREQ